LDAERIVDEIVSVSNAIRFVLVVDDAGKPIHSKIIARPLFINENQAKSLASDMLILKSVLALYDEFVGENTFAHLIRKKTQALIFFTRDWIFLVSCERNTGRHEIADISEKIASIIEKYLA
jgi:hypothetical protein